MSRFVHTWHIPGIRCEHMSDVVRICQNQLAKIENAKHGNFYACLWHLLTVVCIHACIHAIVRTSFFGWDSSMTMRLCKAARVVSCVRLKSQGPKHKKSTLFPPQITQFSWMTKWLEVYRTRILVTTSCYLFQPSAPPLGAPHTIVRSVLLSRFGQGAIPSTWTVFVQQNDYAK